MGLRSGLSGHWVHATLDAIQIAFESFCHWQGSQNRGALGDGARLRSRTPGRHAITNSVRGYRRVLLPLRRGPHARRLREDMRTAEIREAVVGNDLREATLQAPGGGLERRTAPASSGSRAARAIVAKAKTRTFRVEAEKQRRYGG